MNLKEYQAQKENLIKTLAHSFFEKRKTHGHDFNDWLEAEAIINAAVSLGQKTKSENTAETTEPIKKAKTKKQTTKQK